MVPVSNEGIRVLIADDDPTLRGMLAMLVEAHAGGVCVGAVGGASEAIELAIREQPDVALVDVRMPGGGAAAAAGIKLRSPRTKVIALSAHDDRATVLEMLEAGAVGYLVKGASAEAITDAIVNAAEGRGSLSVQVTSQVIAELTAQLAVARRAEARWSELGARIERALDDESLLGTVFQPICDLNDGGVAGVEALSRFAVAPERPPDRWFADAGQVGLRTELELLAVQRAFAAFDQLPPTIYMTVNASPATLLASRFHDLLAATHAERVVVEITEHAPVDDYAELASALDAIRTLGGRIAIDDTGAGFASLSHILQLAPDYIKLDRTLTAGIEDDRSQQVLAAGLIAFSGTLGATLVAEGIERPEQVAVLSELGVPYGQGYWIGRPGRISEGSRVAANWLAPRVDQIG